jgi:hypothetical protein
MSGVKVVTYLLTNNAALLLLAPLQNIVPGVLPLGTVLSSNVGAVSISEVSGVPRNTLAMTEPNKLITDRVQVTVHAKTYPQQKALLAAIIAAVPFTRGVVNGVTVDSILEDVQGPDLPNADLSILMQSQDFVVKWRR